MSLEDSLQDAAVTVVGVAVGAAVKEFLAKQPNVAQKVAAGKALLEEALDLIPEEELHAFLRDDDAKGAELAFRLMKAAKLASYR